MTQVEATIMSATIATFAVVVGGALMLKMERLVDEDDPDRRDTGPAHRGLSFARCAYDAAVVNAARAR